MAASTITGRVLRVIRHGHTVYGNPMMSVVLDVSQADGDPAESSAPATVRIQNNASLVYGIENPEFRDEAHTFKLSRAGRIESLARCEVCGSGTLSHARYCPRG